MSNIVRGGQNLLHYFRMFDQIAKSLFFTAISTILLISGYHLHQTIRLYDLKIYLIYLTAKAYTSIGLKNIPISFNNSHGDFYRSKAIDIISNIDVIRLYHHTNEQIILSTISGIKWGIIISFTTLIIFALKGSQISKKKILRGKNLVSPIILKQIIFLHNLKKQHFNPVKIAGIPFPKDHEKTHTLITGASGTGKTLLNSDLIFQIRRKQQKAIIYDKIGIYVERFYNPATDILLNPLDIRSANWNLLQECIEPSAFDTIAKAFIPSTKSSDPFWENAARIVFSETLNYLKQQGKTDNQALKEIYFSHNQTEFNHIIKSSGILNKILAKDNDRTTGSILSVMISYVRCLKYLSSDNNGDLDLNNSNKNFSIKDWIEDDTKKGFLIISSSSNQHETLKPLISVFLELAINNLLALKTNPNRNIWIFLDELPSLHYLPSLQSGLSQSRQFGGSFVLSLQLMAQLRSIYGHDLATSFSGICRNRVVFPTPDEETANWCSGSLGKVEIEETKENYSYGASQIRDGVSLNKVQQIRPLVLSAEIMNLQNLSCYIGFSGFPLAKSEVKPRNYPQIAERFIIKEEETSFSEIENLRISSEKIAKINSKNIEKTNPKLSSEKLPLDPNELLSTRRKPGQLVKPPQEQSLKEPILDENELESGESEFTENQELNPITTTNNNLF
jgi:type IV conjugative transfer system coupling protein TraD